MLTKNVRQPKSRRSSLLTNVVNQNRAGIKDPTTISWTNIFANQISCKKQITITRPSYLPMSILIIRFGAEFSSTGAKLPALQRTLTSDLPRNIQQNTVKKGFPSPPTSKTPQFSHQDCWTLAKIAQNIQTCTPAKPTRNALKNGEEGQTQATWCQVAGPSVHQAHFVSLDGFCFKAAGLTADCACSRVTTDAMNFFPRDLLKGRKRDLTAVPNFSAIS